MSNGIYDILGKLAGLTPKEEPKKAEPQKVYESVEAKGSILAGIENRLAEDYASMGTGGLGNMGVVGEEEINEKAAPGQEGWIKKNKARFIDQYGKKKGLEVLYATAWKRSKKEESVEEGETTKTATGIRHTKTDWPGYPDSDPEDDVELVKAKGRPRKTQTKKPRVDPNAPKKGRGRPKAEKPPFSGKNAAGALTNIFYGKAPKSHPKGRVHRMDEGRMLDEAGEALEHILTRYASEVKQFETNPNSDMDENLYDALYDYYAAIGEMPYGVQKARTGDPYEWVCQRLEDELGMYEAIGAEGVEPATVTVEPVPAAMDEVTLETELNELARLAGLTVADEGNQFSGALAQAKASHQDTFDVDGKEYPVKEADVAVDGVDGEAEEELANVPDEKYATIKHITTQGDDLNRQKKQDPHTANKAANPLTNDYMQLEARLAAEYESIKKVSK